MPLPRSNTPRPQKDRVWAPGTAGAEGAALTSQEGCTTYAAQPRKPATPQGHAQH